MFGKIVYISDNVAHIEIDMSNSKNLDLINLHIVFEDEKKSILGEVEDISENLLKVRFLGEILDGKFIGGVIRKPNLSAKLRILDNSELKYIIGEDNPNSCLLGYSPLYDNYPINFDINELFSNHMSIFGNTGSGKSWGVASLLQNVFSNKNVIPFKANFFLFDTYGEYKNAFQNIETINPDFRFKCYTTNDQDTTSEMLRIPIWLLKTDELALLLGASEHGQLPIIERVLKLTNIFAESSTLAESYKNHLIAKAIMNTLYTNQNASSKRNDIFSILNTCSTSCFNLEAPVQGIGYVRKFRECFLIDKEGNFTESILVTNYITSFINDELDTYENNNLHNYTLEDLEKALNFTLISEGLLHNDKTYSDAVSIKVKLHAFIINDQSKYFRYPEFINLDRYIASLVTTKDGKKSQIVNFNIEDVEDRIAKAITKIYAKMLFEFTKKLKARASIPFHLMIEEAHRYVQNDIDKELLGYNIFSRIAKEGRKYGLILDLISQRPVDISEDVISQCSNFLIFKMNHPRDLEYMKKMLPNINQEIIEKQKSLQPGTCVAFGSSFKVPMIVKMRIPDPTPYSGNCDVVNTWKA